MSDYIPSYLNLRQYIPQKDVRKLIYAKLNKYDRETVKCAHNSRRKPTFIWTFADYCASYGYLNLLKWARENDCEWSADTCNYAARYGHLETLKWLRANGCPWDCLICTIAARRDRKHILQWLSANNCLCGRIYH